MSTATMAYCQRKVRRQEHIWEVSELHGYTQSVYCIIWWLSYNKFNDLPHLWQKPHKEHLSECRYKKYNHFSHTVLLQRFLKAFIMSAISFAIFYWSVDSNERKSNTHPCEWYSNSKALMWMTFLSSQCGTMFNIFHAWGSPHKHCIPYHRSLYIFDGCLWDGSTQNSIIIRSAKYSPFCIGINVLIVR